MKNNKFYTSLLYYVINRYSLFLFVFLISTFPSFTQQDNSKAPSVEWSSELLIEKEDWLNDVMETSSGHILAVGFSRAKYLLNLNDPNTDIYIKKPTYTVFDESGRPLKHHKAYNIGNNIGTQGGAETWGEYKQMIEADDGSFYLIGFNEEANPNAVTNPVNRGGVDHIIIAKLDQDFNIVYEKFLDHLSTSPNAEELGFSIQSLPNGNLLLAGSGINNSGQSDAFLAIMDQQGNVISSNNHYLNTDAGISDIKVIENNNTGAFQVVFTGTKLIMPETIPPISTDSNSDGLMHPLASMSRENTDIIVGRVNLQNIIDGVSANPFIYTLSSASPNSPANAILPAPFCQDPNNNCEIGLATPGLIDPSFVGCHSPAIDKYFMPANNSKDEGHRVVVIEDVNGVQKVMITSLIMRINS